jgi:hypothetical protein
VTSGMKPTGPFYLESKCVKMKKYHDELKLLHIFVAEPIEVDSSENNGDEYEVEMFFVAQDAEGCIWFAAVNDTGPCADPEAYAEVYGDMFVAEGSSLCSHLDWQSANQVPAVAV